MLGFILSTPATQDEIAEINEHNYQAATEEQLGSKDIILDELRFKTHATLVACPNHLAQQWKDQLIQHTEPPLKVIMFSTLTELKTSTYQNIMEAGKVVLTVK